MSKKGGKVQQKEVASYNERDIVLGKVRGFPPWPGMVVDPDSVPPAVQQERPGKKNNFYCVQFFPTGDYAWLVPKDISKLLPVEIEAYINEPYKKSGDLLLGYRTALDPTAWEAKRAATLAALPSTSDDDEDDDQAEEGIDELVSDDEDGKKKKPAKKESRKRKRESDVAEPKTRKGPKEREKDGKKASTAKKAPAKGGRKSKGGAKSQALVESEDGGAEDDAEGEEVGVSTSVGGQKDKEPPAKKSRRDEEDGDANMQTDPEAIKVRDWRHRLQKAFLSNKTTPDEADMPALDTLFSTVEAYENITVAYLQFSKIGKVMRHITLLEDHKVPRDKEFGFKRRAQKLVERWQSVLGAAKDGGSGVGAGKEKDEKDGEKEKEKEPVNGKAVNGTASESTPAPVAGENSVVELGVKIALNGPNAGTVYTSGDVDMTVPTDADAPGEVEDVLGQTEADAPGETEDVAMAEA